MADMDQGFTEIEHTADVSLLVWGQDLTELFVNSANGLACLISDPATVDQVIETSFDLEGYDAETLLVTWLGELLYLYERDGSIFTSFSVAVTPTHLQGTARGGPSREARQSIKAVTFSELNIQRTERGLETVLVFDV
jgi:SHS2 domain-containing protein